MNKVIEIKAPDGVYSLDRKAVELLTGSTVTNIENFIDVVKDQGWSDIRPLAKKEKSISFAVWSDDETIPDEFIKVIDLDENQKNLFGE